MEHSYQDLVTEWLSAVDETSKKEILRLQQEDPKMLEDLFSQSLSFGTAGIREKMGIGPSLMNTYTIRQATQGVANYIKKKGTLSPLRVAICYDCRNHSREFAYETAKVFAGNDIEVFITEELRPTPYCSYLCRKLQCQAAIMITASHNPPEYNGYKVYWADGAQVTPPHDTGIVDEVKKITKFSQVYSSEEGDGRIQLVSPEYEEAYLKEIDALCLRPKENLAEGKTLSVIYTSLHGCGITLVPQALKRWGFTNLHFVEKQIIPDGNFPTAHKPNPEETEALTLSIELLKKKQGDILLATDPDSDRIAMCSLDSGKLTQFNGNELAILLLDYLLHTLYSSNKLPKNGAAIKSIVTTDAFTALCDHYKITCVEVLTGFKYIGGKIHEWELNNHPYQFVFGAEQSFGYLYGTHARDKDATITACLISEMALYHKKSGRTLPQALEKIYETVGYFSEDQISIETDKGSEIVDHLRSSLPKKLGGKNVLSITDYQTSTQTDLKDNSTSKIELPKSNVLTFILDEEYKIIVRPSGTEPKVKLYGMRRHTQPEPSTTLSSFLELVQKELFSK